MENSEWRNQETLHAAGALPIGKPCPVVEMHRRGSRPRPRGDVPPVPLSRRQPVSKPEPDYAQGSGGTAGGQVPLHRGFDQLKTKHASAAMVSLALSQPVKTTVQRYQDRSSPGSFHPGGAGARTRKEQHEAACGRRIVYKVCLGQRGRPRSGACRPAGSLARTAIGVWTLVARRSPRPRMGD